MTPRESFKYGFLLRCQEANLTPEQSEKLANDLLEKQANPLLALLGSGVGYGIGGLGNAVSGISEGLGHFGAAALPIAVAAGAGSVALPYYGGAGIAKMVHNKQKDLMNEYNTKNKVDPQDFQNIELVNEYNRMSNEVRKQIDTNKKQLGNQDALKSFRF